MSLMFKQIYVRDASPQDLLKALNRQFSNRFNEVDFYGPHALEKLTAAEKSRVFGSAENWPIYKQFGVTVLQIGDRQKDLKLDIDIQQVSTFLNTLVIWLQYYEGYGTLLKMYEKGKKILEVISQVEQNLEVEKFETDDPRFIKMKDRINELQSDDSKESVHKMYEEKLVLSNHPEVLFSPINMSFSDLYNPDYDNLEEVLLYKYE